MTTAGIGETVPSAPYRNAPIIEAVIDIHVEFPSDSPVLELLRSIVEDLAAEFPRRETIHQFQVALAAEIASSTAQSSRDVRQIGWKLFNESGDRVLMLQQHSFSYSHLAPYTQWELFSSECKKLWRLFLDRGKPVQVTRLGVRNINRLKLPPGDIELSEYLNFAPDFPGVFGTVGDVLMRIRGPQLAVGPGGRAIVTLASEHSEAKDHQPVVLDIDIIVESRWSPDEVALWDQLERLRERKNELFEACITDATRKLFA